MKCLTQRPRDEEHKLIKRKCITLPVNSIMSCICTQQRSKRSLSMVTTLFCNACTVTTSSLSEPGWSPGNGWSPQTPWSTGQPCSHSLTIGNCQTLSRHCTARALVDNHQMSDCCPVMLFCWPSYFSKTGLSLIHGNHRKLVHGEDVWLLSSQAKPKS